MATPAVSDATFDSEVRQSATPVVVDFWAEWCGPCRVMGPILEDLKRRVGEQATVIKIDVDRNQAAAQAYQVQGVPTLIVFKNGQPVWRRSGVMSAEQLQQVITPHF